MNMGKTLQNTIDNSDAEGRQYLTFILADEEYGVEILRVQEIRGWTKVTPMPNSPSYLKGVLHLRDHVVPIIDLRARFGMESLEYGPTTVVIIVQVEASTMGQVIGIVVDAVSEVYTFNPDDCQVPPVGDIVEEQFVNGLVKIDDKMVILLDVDILLNANVLNSLTSTPPVETQM